MIVYFATDHAGFHLKEALLPYVRDVLGHEVVDCGAYAHEPLDDYPDSMAVVGRIIHESPHDRCALIFGGSGQGEAMVLNRFPHVRATVFYGGSLDIITLSREHNNANVLSLGARFLDVETAEHAVRLWLATPFTHDERHERRISKIDDLSRI
jgi:ribose 5-phosphate isomerase B